MSLNNSKEWVKKRQESLKKEDGWFSLIGLFRLQAGQNVIGRFSGVDGCTVGLLDMEKPDQPEKHCPEPILGTLTVNSGNGTDNEPSISFAAACAFDAPAMKSGDTLSPVLANTVADGPTVFRHGLLIWFVKSLGNGQYAIRVKDKEARSLVKFPGSIPMFPLSEVYRVTCQFVANDEKNGAVRKLKFGNSDEEDSYGVLKFQLHGQQLQLTPSGPPTDRMEILIADATTAKETYGGGRFVWTEGPVSADQTVILDFNTAYNPPCCFTDFCTCPRPLKENTLPVKIEAGEKTYVRPE